MPDWKPTKPIPGPSRPAPIVHLGPPELFVQEIELRGLQTPKIFRNADRFDVKDSSGIVVSKLEGLGGFAKGEEIEPPHWHIGRTTNYPVCLLRGRKVTVIAKLRVKTTGAAVAGKVTATPVLEGDATQLKAATVDFSIPAGAETTTVSLDLSGKLPMEVGRFQLFLKWTAAPSPDFSFIEVETPHTVFVHYEAPFTAAFDSSAEKEAGQRVKGSIPFPSTVTGTPKRLDKLMSLLGPRRRHPATGLSSDLEDLLWAVHIGINDAPGAPHFNPIHDEHLTHNGDRRKIFVGRQVQGTGNILPLEEQWLMWVGSPSPHWNAGSCIGHVQLAKTMLAAIGIFVRRSWILPKTEQMPDGSTIKLAESDLYGLGHFNHTRQQSHKFTHKGRELKAEVRLMEPGQSYENFEACLRTPAGRFLPGGYTTAGIEKDHKGFIKNKGFSSAFELLQWWCSTKRGSFQRFMCWVNLDDATEAPLHCWDRDGKHYDIKNYERIFNTGKHLLPPKAVKP